jgi:hypothetical protein
MESWRRRSNIIWEVTRVNLSNVLDKGLRIERIGCQMNLKVKIIQTRRNLQYY